MRVNRMTRQDPESSEAAQMLLAAGMVLLMSLLSMAVYGVKLAGLGTPYDSGADELLDVSRELQLNFAPLMGERTQIRIDAGMNWLDAAESALQSVHDDYLHHGELRGVEIKMLEMTASNNSGVLTISAEAGLSDSHAMLELPLSMEFTPSS